MINYLSLNINYLSVNFIGNKAQGEDLFLSKHLVTNIDDLTKEALIQYFIESFKSEVYYNFQHVSDLNLNEVFNYVSQIFESPKYFHKISIHLAKFLYEKTLHPNIKSGEFYVVYFQNIELDGTKMDAIGLFKSETKEIFLKVFQENQSYQIERHSGINIKNLDKGCLIFNTSKRQGYKVCVIDNLNKSIEAQFWKNDFLNVKESLDEYHFTKNFLTVTKNFIVNKLSDDSKINKADQIEFLNKSVNYFKEHDIFNLNEFEQNVFQESDIIESFRNFGSSYIENNNTPTSDNFEISNQAVKKQAKHFKSIIKLDKNFHIYIHGDRALIEEGYDAKKGKKYYKIYFDNES